MFSPLFRQGVLIVFTLLLLGRRIWHYFKEPADDDFATLSRAYWWVFPQYLGLLVLVLGLEVWGRGNGLLSLSLLALAFSLRRYYCEGDFANHPLAQKIHLALRCLLIALACCPLPVFIWGLAAPLPILYSLFYNHEDLAEHRRELNFFLWGCLILAGMGAALGYFVPVPGSLADHAAFRMAISALLFCLPLLYAFIRWQRRVWHEAAGGFFFDMIFSEGAFAEKGKRLKHLPEVTLLRHWRDNGEINKVWRTAKAHLYPELRALPIWLFAIETAILHRRKPDEALKLLRRLCEAGDIPHDHRSTAVAQTRYWMAAAGFPFDATPFQIEKPVLDPSGVADKIQKNIREGRFSQAESLLRSQLGDFSQNEPAFTQLVRLYCQDMKDRAGAERLIADARDSLGPQFLDFLSGSLDDWMRMPMRSTVKPRKFFGIFRRPAQPDVAAKKLVLGPDPAAAPAVSGQNPLESYLQRVKESRPPPPDTSQEHDPVERLLRERRLGTAVELLKAQAEAAPDNFAHWLRYAEAVGNHCGNILGAERIIRKMERSGHFKKTQMKKAVTHLNKWREKHPTRASGW